MTDGPSKDELVEIFKSLKATQKGNKVRAFVRQQRSNASIPPDDADLIPLLFSFRLCLPSGLLRLWSKESNMGFCHLRHLYLPRLLLGTP